MTPTCSKRSHPGHHQRQYFQFENATFTQYEAGRTVIVGLRGKF